MKDEKNLICPDCKNIINDKATIRCPRCNKILIKLTCEGNCSKCKENNSCQEC